MRDAFANYDQYLEAPFQRMCEEYDMFVDWCERNDYDPEDPESEDAYNDAMIDEYAYDDEEPEDWDDQEDAW